MDNLMIGSLIVIFGFSLVYAYYLNKTRL